MHNYADEVKEAFAKTHGDGKHLTSGRRLQFQNDAAKDLLDGSYAHLIPELKDAVKEEHDIGMAEWDLELSDISLAGDITQYDLLFSVSGHF